MAADPQSSPLGNTRPRIAVLIPTLNEEKSIGDLIARIPRDLVSRIIVADGGSRDATVDSARSAGAEVIAAGSGYGRACLAAAKTAADSEILVFMDGDGADDPRAIPALVQPILAGEQDFVIGSRIPRPSSASRRMARKAHMSV
jgi:glycosyltransferase involved in cell wall biosynthesis